MPLWLNISGLIFWFAKVPVSDLLIRPRCSVEYPSIRKANFELKTMEKAMGKHSTLLPKNNYGNVQFTNIKRNRSGGEP